MPQSRHRHRLPPAVQHTELSAPYFCLCLPCIFAMKRYIRHSAPSLILSQQRCRLMKRRMLFAKSDQLTYKLKQSAAVFPIIPVQPCSLIVLTIHIVISILCVAELIPARMHGVPCENISRKNAFLSDAAAVPEPPFSVSPLRTAVPAVIIIRTVLIALSVCLIMLPVIRDQVTECKPCM